MAWRSPQTVPFTRIGIVSQVPSESGVFGLVSGDACLLVAESWNLKARLLDLINILAGPVELSVVFELCPESEAEARCQELHKELMISAENQPATGHPPGISFWSAPAPGTESSPETRDY